MVIDNYIFSSYRQEQEKIEEAIALLEKKWIYSIQ